jgi:acyl-CoA thioester hydrolase
VSGAADVSSAAEGSRPGDDARYAVSKRGEHVCRVRYQDTDKAGVVHHAAYLGFLEAARIEFFRENGFDYAAFERETQTGMPVVDASLRYRAPARFDDEIVIETRIVEATRFTARISGIVRRGDRVLVESTVRLACVHMTLETPTRMPRALYDACLEPGYSI